MRQFIKIFTMLVIPAILLTMSPIRKSLALEDAILAIVNEEVITLKDLRDYVRGIYVSLAAEGRTEAEIEKIMLDLEINGLNKLIEDKLLISKAKEIGLIIKDKLVDERINTIKERYPSEQVFMEALINNGGTMTDLRKKISEQLKIRFVIDHEVKSKIYVNPQEVTDYYNNNITSFQEKEKVDVQSIYIPYGEDKDAAIKKANVALELIKNGDSFVEIQKEYSDSSSLGTVERGQLLPEIEKEIFHLNENEPSDVFPVDTGVYIFQVTKKHPAELASLGEVKDFITNQLFSQKFNQRLLAWLEKLKKDAYIEIKQ